MWRPSLRSLSPKWWKSLALIALFTLGALFNNYVMPWLARDIDVWVIQGVKGQGCKGSWGSTKVRFGQGIGQTDGVYDIPCDKLSVTSDTTALRCNCD